VTTSSNGTAPRTDHWPAPREREILEGTEPADDRLLTADQLADRWQLGGGRQAVYRMTREGKIPVVRLGKFRRFRVSAILAFEEAGGTEGD
jgi:excisionase family DNA binding protein